MYEFYCRDCHTIYNFYSQRINTTKVPACPDPECTCQALQRQVSLFSISKGREEGSDDDMFAGLDESKLEQVMMSLAGEMEGVDEDDPKQAAQIMRKLFDSTGMDLSESMREAIHRMESGDDPEKIEQEMGSLLETDNPFSPRSKKLLNDLRRKYLPPKIDERLYDL